MIGALALPAVAFAGQIWFCFNFTGSIPQQNNNIEALARALDAESISVVRFSDGQEQAWMLLDEANIPAPGSPLPKGVNYCKRTNGF